MTARFILSLDCEGKWGVADILTPAFHQDLADEKLKAAYGAILLALDDFEIPATFAFVGAFAQPSAKFAEISDGLRKLAVKAPHYLGPALADLASGSREGWHGEWAVERVATAAMVHEIAWHGMTHVPWSNVDEDFIDMEIQLWRSMSGPVHQSRTFVFPRNSVAHLDRLAAAGIKGYREARPSASKIHSFLSEFNIRELPDPDPVSSAGMIAIPAGFFVNWQHGPRRLVPRGLSARRAANILEAAHVDDAVVHFWLHPENLASAPKTIDVLRDLLRLVANQRERGDCRVLTQAHYCAELQNGGRPLKAYV